METIIELTHLNPEVLTSLVQDAAVDQQAFTRLYRHYLPRVYRYVLSRVGDQDAAEDICGQVFLTLLQKISGLRDPQRFSAWLFSIARNKCMDHFRALNRERDRAQALTWLFEDQQVQPDDLGGLEKAFQGLPELEQEVLRLRFLGDMTLNEVAQVLQQPLPALKSRYYRSLQKLHLSMTAEEYHD